MTCMYVMAKGMLVNNATDRAIIDRWFPIHFTHDDHQCHLATGFNFASDDYEVLQIILKAHFLHGEPYLIPETEFASLMESNHASSQISEGQLECIGGYAITLRSWIRRMQQRREQGRGTAAPLVKQIARHM